ncbi:hypothetical protein PIPA1_04490 [Pelosinus sp. IPA-1]|nr:hypothetical protein PIPA1_04490 [Pelosinus sp. IPA-1]
MTSNTKKGNEKKYRKEALQIQLPPDKSMARFKTNVDAKKKDANIPIKITFIIIPPL